MPKFYLLDGQDLGTTRVRLGSEDGYVSVAEQGTVSTSMVQFDDPNADLTVTGWRPFAVIESLCTSHPSIFRGYIAARNIRRGDSPGSSLRQSAARLWDSDIVDLNALFYFRVIHLKEGKRPQETDIERMEWILGSQWLSPYIADNGLVDHSSEPATLDEADYRGQYPADVLNDCVRARFGKNYFAYWDEAKGASLFYGPTSATTFTSTLRISNTDADEDSVTTFAPWSDAVLNRDPSGTYAGIYLQGGFGAIRRRLDSTASNYILREITVRNDRIGKLSTAESIASQLLVRMSTEEDRITCTVRLPADKVNLIREGMRIECKFTHLPGYESFQFLRVLRRLVKQTFEADVWYDVQLELVGGRPTGGGGPGTPPGGGGGGPGPFVPPATCAPALVQWDEQRGLLTGGALHMAAPVTAGNLLVILTSNRDGDADGITVRYPPGTTDAGFTLGPDGVGSTGNVSEMVIHYKIAAGDEQDLIMDGGAHTSVYFEFSGVSAVDGHSEANGTISAGGGVWTGAAATLTGSGVVVASITSETSDVHVASQAWGAGWTEVFDYSAGTSPFFGPASSFAYRIATAGSYTPSGTETIDGGGSHGFVVQALGFICNASDEDAAPGPGQQTCEEFTGDGCTDEFALNHPYLENSLNLKIGGIPATPEQTDPDAGIFGTPFLVSSGVPIIACYQAGAGPATGSNNPQPSSTTLIAPQMLGSGAVGAGLLTLTDAQAYVPFRLGNQGGLELTSIGSNGTIDVSAANVFEITLQSDLTFTLENVPQYLGRESDITLLLRQSGTGPWGVTWPANISWTAGEPELSTSSNSVTPVGLMTLDQGDTWIGLTGGGSTSADDIWRPVMAYDGSNWMVVVAADGTAVMAQG